ncbi:MAG TPA: HlyD family efflux transporter periplasmic adaptor subunit [Ignavibacteria bacterium]|nr:HlyD family efflux transporter periplasmic adaptor subunit [Ignavibacteria bacterium]
MHKKTILFLLAGVIVAFAGGCSKDDNRSDAYGNFEAVETIVSSESSGKLLEFNVEEGQTLNEGSVVGYIDTVQLQLKKKQLEAAKNLTRTKFKNVSSQVGVYREQKKVALREKDRIERLLKDNAATGKQLDDINGSIDVLNRQIAAVETQNNTTNEELKNYDVQIKQIDDQLSKSTVVNPVNGTVIMKFAEQSEVVNYGKPLYKIADLSVMELRVYVSGSQLPEIKIGQTVKVLIDNGKSEYRNLEGEIFWISSKAEFTPKIVQTKEERVNLVYAVKVRVKNDGSLKIGMPGEVMFK